MKTRVAIVGAALAVLAVVLSASCGGSLVERGDIRVIERVSVYDAQGDLLLEYACTGTLDARECALNALEAGVRVVSVARYTVPYVGPVGADLDVRADLEGLMVTASPVLGPLRIDPVSYVVERDREELESEGVVGEQQDGNSEGAAE